MRFLYRLLLRARRRRDLRWVRRLLVWSLYLGKTKKIGLSTSDARAMLADIADQLRRV